MIKHSKRNSPGQHGMAKKEEKNLICCPVNGKAKS
jgi:hypothetical protein